MYPDPNPLKLKLARGQQVGGLYIQSPSVDNVEIAAAVGIDFVIIDLEHGSIGFSECVALIRAAESAGIAPVVRTADHDPTAIRKVLENGALGIYVPGVESASQARAAVAAARIADGRNGGLRGACPEVRAVRRRVSEWPQFVSWSNANVAVFLIVESQAGLAELPAIAAIEGVDGLLFGRFDLAHELGCAAGPYAPEVERHYQDFCRTAAAAGVPHFSPPGQVATT